MKNQPSTPEIFQNQLKFKSVLKSRSKKQIKNMIFKNVCLCTAFFSVFLLSVLIVSIVYLGVRTLDFNFLSSPPDPDPLIAGFFPAIAGSVWLLVLVAFFAIPLGTATAVAIEEFAPKNKFLRIIHSIIQTNITNLAGVPSVVYGIIGITLFVSMFQFFGQNSRPGIEIGVSYYDQFYSEAEKIIIVPVSSKDDPETVPVNGIRAYSENGEKIILNVIGEDAPWPEDEALSKKTLRDYAYPGRIHEQKWYYFRIPFGRGVLSGALTLMLVILPIIITAARESLKAVPHSLREAAWGMGATKWQTVWKITLPSAVPGIMTGTILALSRAIGEAAPLLMIAGIVFITNAPGNIMDDFTAMPLQIYNWAQRPQAEFHSIAASGIIILLAVLLIFNAAAVYIRKKYTKQLS
jgi:phosphate transport system permease protein